MNISNYRLIEKKISNTSRKDKYVSDVLLYETHNIKEININPNNIKVFRSARHKNDMPTIFKLGVNNQSLQDSMIKITETGSNLIKNQSNIIISDHLTILGDSNKAFMITFLGGKKHLIRTELKLDNNYQFESIKVYAEINKLLKPKETFKTEQIEIYNTDNVSKAIDDFVNKKMKDVKVKTKDAPSVYCTWYFYGQTINQADCLNNLDLITEKKLPLDTFQIDDGWEDYIGDWNGNNKFLYDIAQLSKEISKHNLIPGIWTSPFIMSTESKLAKLHPEWILKDNKKKPLIFLTNNNPNYIIDITIKETWDYFEKLYKRLTKLGFKYHKLDFTRAPITAINPNFKNKYITIIEAYRNACLKIRKGMGDSFFLMCGGLYDPLIGIVDAQRTGSDVLSMWSAMNRGGKTLPYTMKQNLLRYYMNAWWYNDPDSFVIRKNVKIYKGLNLSLGLLTDDEAKTSSMNQLLGGGLFSMTEPLDIIDEKRLNYFKHILPLKKIKIELMNIMDTPRFPDFIKIKHNKNTYLVVINYEDNKIINKTIKAKDILNNDSKAKITISLKPHASTILKLSKDKITEINTKGHYLC